MQALVARHAEGGRPAEDRALSRRRHTRSAIYAGAIADHRVRGVVMIAPHFIAEDISVTSIAEIKSAYETTELRAKLARWHNDVDNAFYGWNGAWLDPQFRAWD